MSTLYRDYRPQNFSEVIGQNHIKITLQNEILAGRPAGAYLFCGPRAVGKTTMARVLAKSLNCERRSEGDANPCNLCPACQSIATSKNLEVMEIDAASNTGVDNVRDNIIAFSRLAPNSSKFKVFIIDEVHMLSLSAFNALLKIIEEPPSYVVFILCTTEIQKVPATIISRCERFDFRRISVSDVIKKLRYIAQAEKVSIADDILAVIARRSGGHLRDAESLLGQILSLGDKEVSAEQAELVMPHYNSQEALDLISHLSRKDAAKAIALINGLVDNGVSIKIFIAEVVVFLRKMMLAKLSPELEDSLGLDWGEDLEKKLAPLTAALSLEQIIHFTKRFLELSLDAKNPAIPQLPLEIAVGELCFGLVNLNNDTTEQSRSLSGRQSSPTSKNIKDKDLESMADNKSIPRLNIMASEKISAVTAEELTDKIADKSSALPINLDQADLKAKWPELLIKIKKYNHSLSFVLQNCEPRSIEDSRLFLSFKYKFHQDRINDPSIKLIIDKVLIEVFGSSLIIESVLDENLIIKRELKAGVATSLKPEPVLTDTSVISKTSEAATVDKSSSPLMSDLLKTFGGEVLN